MMNTDRTLSGVDNNSVNHIYLPASTSALIVGGNIGAKGQVLAKNEDDNKLEWSFVDKITIPDNSIAGEKLKSDITFTTTGNITLDNATDTATLRSNIIRCNNEIFVTDENDVPKITLTGGNANDAGLINADGGFTSYGGKFFINAINDQENIIEVDNAGAIANSRIVMKSPTFINNNLTFDTQGGVPIRAIQDLFFLDCERGDFKASSINNADYVLDVPQGNARVGGDLYVGGNLDVQGDTTKNGNLTINGIMSAEEVRTFSGAITGVRLYDVDSHGNIDVNDNNGDRVIHIDGEEGEVFIGRTGFGQADLNLLTGHIRQSATDSTSINDGNLFMDDLYCNQDIILSGNIGKLRLENFNNQIEIGNIGTGGGIFFTTNSTAKIQGNTSKQTICNNLDLRSTTNLFPPLDDVDKYNYVKYWDPSSANLWNIRGGMTSFENLAGYTQNGVRRRQLDFTFQVGGFGTGQNTAEITLTFTAQFLDGAFFLGLYLLESDGSLDALVPETCRLIVGDSSKHNWGIHTEKFVLRNLDPDTDIHVAPFIFGTSSNTTNIISLYAGPNSGTRTSPYSPAYSGWILSSRSLSSINTTRITSNLPV